MHGVPDQVADAAAEMQDKGEGVPEQHDPADQGRDGPLYHAIGKRARRHRREPTDRHNGADIHEDAGNPDEDRQDRRELRSVVLEHVSPVPSRKGISSDAAESA